MGLFPPGSVGWLLSNEIRIAMRGWSGKGGRSVFRQNLRLILIAVMLVGFGGFGGWQVAGLLVRHPPQASPLLFLGIEAGMGFIFMLMISQSLTLSAQAFYERNDLDLLLSSPLPPARVLTVRAVGIAVLAGALYLALASCLVIPLAIRGAYGWLSVYLVIADLALLATALGLLLAMALFRILGPRRTRVVSQVLAAVLGSGAFLLSQLRNFLPKAQWNALLARFTRLSGVGYDVAAPYAWPARAFLGELLPLAAVTLVCVGAFALVTGALGRRFGSDAASAAGISEAAGPSRRRTGQADRLRFAGGPLRTLVRKDTRLLLRDPWLLSQMLLQMLYFVPLGFLVLRNVQTGGEAVLAIAAPLAFLAGQLAGNLTWVMVSAEDSPELIASAPIAPSATLRAKLLVALTPVAVLAAGPLAVMAWAAPLKGLYAALCCVGACVTASLINLWYAKPANRKDMMRRRNSSGLMGIVEVVLLLGWGATSYLAMGGFVWAVMPPVVIGVSLLLLRRPMRYGVVVA